MEPGAGEERIVAPGAVATGAVAAEPVVDAGRGLGGEAAPGRGGDERSHQNRVGLFITDWISVTRTPVSYFFAEVDTPHPCQIPSVTDTDTRTCVQHWVGSGKQG